MLLGSLIAYVLVVLTGAFWYSPLVFGTVWEKVALKGKKAQNVGRSFVLTFLSSGVAVFCLSLLLGSMPVMSCSVAAWTGLLVGVFMFFIQVGHSAFGAKPPLQHLIDSSHDVVCAVLASVAINYFRA